jgi:hypothetical protein
LGDDRTKASWGERQGELGSIHFSLSAKIWVICTELTLLQAYVVGTLG